MESSTVMNKVVDKSGRESLTIRMNPALQKRIKVQAAHEENTMSDVIEIAVTKYLEKNPHR